jgi:hypothetical protein
VKALSSNPSTTKKIFKKGKFGGRQTQRKDNHLRMETEIGKMVSQDKEYLGY